VVKKFFFGKKIEIKMKMFLFFYQIEEFHIRHVGAFAVENVEPIVGHLSDGVVTALQRVTSQKGLKNRRLKQEITTN
jgi:hypothetical protein